MQRDVYDRLIEWKNNPSRKPLILEGARQVGKTWLMLELAKTYRNYIYVNFDKDSWAKELFLIDYDISRILLVLQAHSDEHIVAGETLIIFDELQEAERGLNVLKYFYEDAPEQHVIVAGSLLGITLHSGQSFPVGKVDIIKVFPLTFIEYLRANGENIKADCITQQQWKVMASIAPTYINLLRQYFYVGGMPEAVKVFAEKKDLQLVRTIQQNILEGYKNDISKHAPLGEVKRILMVLQSLPSQLSKENKKFIYGVLRQGARAKDYEVAIQWLIDAGIVYKINRATQPTMPLAMYEEIDVFKLFMLDCGLLACLADVPASQILTSDNIFKEWKGAFSEQYVLQQLLVSQPKISYWSSNDSKCEIDFLLQTDQAIVPIEVKAEENVKSKSLHYFVTELYPQLHGIRFSMKDYIQQDWITNVPLYAASSGINNCKQTCKS